MKKVLIFSTAYYPLVGGAEVAIKEITERNDNYHFDLITAKIKPGLVNIEKIGNVSVYRVGFGNKIDKFLLPILGLFKAIELNKKNKYDLTWSMMASQASVVASFFKIKNNKIPLLLTLQEGDEEEHLKRYALGNNFLYKFFIQPWHTLVFKKADFIQVISNDLAKRARENNKKCDIEVVPNAVNIAHFTQEYSEKELASLKKELGKKEDDKYVITTSRLAKKNAVDDVIKAMKYLPENVKFIILGDGEDREMLEKLAKDEGVTNRVKFLGMIDQKIMPKYLKISDIFIRPSLSEGLGNSFLEAMVAGLPTIATPVGGIPDFLFDNETGFFCKVRNPESIAEKIKYILDKKNIEKIEKVTENAEKLVRNKYDWNIIAQNMNKIFQKVIK